MVRRSSYTEDMLKIDVHSHILPGDWPDLAKSTATTASP